LNIGKGVDNKLGNERKVIWADRYHDGKNRQEKGSTHHNHNVKIGGTANSNYTTKGNSEWEGWGTALKPAHEPIVMARKPLSEKTVVDNVLKWGTGGINIDESRIGNEGATKRSHQAEYEKKDDGTEDRSEHWARTGHEIIKLNEGRFPANIIFDEEAGKILDKQSGTIKSSGGTRKKNDTKYDATSYNKINPQGQNSNPYAGEVGGASRFFYCPKTSKKDRNEGLDEFEEKQQDLSRKEGNVGGDNPRNRGVNKRKNHHPTVKPTDLMLYLIRLVTPKGGTTLDPFMGSGSTGKAAVRGGFDFVGIERENEYMEIAEARIQYEIECTNKKNKYKQIDLF